jgi:hypothetical protein
MTPETVSAINAVCSLLERIGTWPIGTVLLVILFGPWVMAFLVSRSQEKRFDAMREMYKNNVKLVEGYERLAKGQQETIMLNTAKFTEAIEKIDTNQFCPAHRTRKIRMEDVQT